ncbi:Fic family protein [Pyxidicoccus sp. MSG2]|uniref:Fic family protein n=1 Tax=Pyxidicoccus sp. MSG2 TaxID=2996790 RepID=UPI0022700FF8|nr:Fic family protein [Pyxidicoccus sp. MSG2]MCY1017472.1 Fic family protein [Pyxidicoccus sp. MSG2]
MPQYTFEDLVGINQEVRKITELESVFGHDMARKQEDLKKIISRANEMTNDYESAAYLALTIYLAQVFNDGNTRTGAIAIHQQLQAQGIPLNRSVSEIKNWLTANEIPNLRDSQKTQGEFAMWLLM